MRAIKTAICVLVSMLAMSLASAEDLSDVDKKLRECAGCHGADGISIAPTMPNLAGQKEAYLIAALTAYRDGTRSGVDAAMMTAMANGLSDAEIVALAKHFSSLK